MLKLKITIQLVYAKFTYYSEIYYPCLNSVEIIFYSFLLNKSYDHKFCYIKKS